MRSTAASVEEYLSELPDERRKAIEAVRQVILANLPEGYEETMNWGMISYQVPLSIYSETYNGKALLYAALASQKNHMAVYLTAIYMDDTKSKWFKEAYRRTGKRLDAGRSCFRFRRLEDLPLDLVGETIASMKMEEFIERMKKLHRRM